MYTINDIRKIEFGLTTFCNAGCPLCARHHYGTSDVRVDLNSLSIDIFDKIISEFGFRTKNIKTKFGGTAGDIIMHKQAFDLISTSVFNYKHTNVDTNGGVRSKKWWSELGKLSKYGSLLINFSIDGLSDTNNIYRINTNFEKIIENATSYINAGGNAAWKFVIFKHNEHQVYKAKELAEKLKFKRFAMVDSNRFNSKNKEKAASIKPTSFKNNYDKINQYSKKSEQLKKEMPDINCRAINSKEIYIDEKGNLWPCCHLHGAFLGSNQNMKNYFNNIFKMYGDDFLNLEKNSINDVLSNDWFSNYLPNGWTDEKKVCIKCQRTCAKNKEFSITDREEIELH